MNLKELKSEMIEEGTKQLAITDPKSRAMKIMGEWI